MQYIPDPIERMEARIDDLAFEWNVLQRNASPGCFICPVCKKESKGEPIQTSGSPDSGVCCYECLPDDLKKAYDKFFGS